MELWHGSRDIVKRPSLDRCNPHNDYGAAFYCTPSQHMACEWACPTSGNGFANHYRLEAVGLQVLDLQSGEYGVLHWLAVLAAHRLFDPQNALASAGLSYLQDNFLLDVGTYDVVRGYRADDSYFSFARAFLNNTITVGQLAEAMRLGDLGIQYALRTQTALDNLHFIGVYRAPGKQYYPLRNAGDLKVRTSFKHINSTPDLDGLFIRDIIRSGITPEDPRLYV